MPRRNRLRRQTYLDDGLRLPMIMAALHAGFIMCLWKARSKQPFPPQGDVEAQVTGRAASAVARGFAAFRWNRL